jgi:D-glycero-D-manno-heptose 1,7-bisphosphate phosphatase
MTRLILLDRDGVINFDSPDYIKDADEWIPIPGSIEAISELKRAGYLVAVCSNQAGVGRGIFSEAALERIHARMRAALAGHAVALDGLRYCPHHPDAGCACRKPQPGMLSDMMKTLGIAAADTIFVGDAVKDLEAARAAGCRAALVRTGCGAAAEPQARAMGVDCIADDLAAFTRTLLGTASC